MIDNRNHTIDLVKGLAIIMVVITHYEWTEAQRKIVVFPYVINMAIPIFMIITGYVYSLSFTKQRIKHLEDAFPCHLIIRRITRYTLPVVIVIVWELCDPHFSVGSGLLKRLRWAIDGTYGSGNYYYPVMMQLVFVFPLIFFLIEKNKEKGLLICFIANVVYELLAWAYVMNSSCYRLLSFRYVFLIAVGVYAFKGFKFSLWISLLMTSIGAFFITIVIYFKYEPRIINKDWASTNFLSSMLIIPLMVFILQNAKFRFKPLEIIGQCSYHIFLVQMMYYLGYSSLLKSKISSWQVHLIIGSVICLGIGIAFYYAEKPLQNQIQCFIKKLSEKKNAST